MERTVEPVGDCSLGIIFLKGIPSETEEEKGLIFSDEMGSFCSRVLRRHFGIRFDSDCYATSILKYRTPNGKLPKMSIRKPYLELVEDEIRSRKPRMIFALGEDAINFVLPACPVEVTDLRLRGRVIPSKKFGCPVCCLISEAVSNDFMNITQKDICFGMDRFEMGDSFDGINEDEGNLFITGSQEFSASKVESFFTDYIEAGEVVAFDYETTSKFAHTPDAKILGVSLSNNPKYGIFIPLQYPGSWSAEEENIVADAWRRFLLSDVPKSCQNMNFEYYWSKLFYGVEVNNIVYDTCLGYHVIDERGKICNLAFQEFECTGAHHKDMVNVENLLAEPFEKMAKYACLDARYQIMLTHKRLDFIRRHKWPERPTKTLMSAVPSLVRARVRGVGVNREELIHQHQEALVKSKELKEKICEGSIGREFSSKFGHELNHGSIADTRSLFIKQLKLPPAVLTKTGGVSAGKEALEGWLRMEGLGEEVSEFIQDFSAWKKVDTLLDTFLVPYLELTKHESVLRPEQALYTTRTMRSSCFDPNLQQIPKRDESQKGIRKIFVPNSGDLFLDGDNKASEVRVIAALSGDPNLTKEILRGDDTHGYWTSRVLEKNQCDVTGAERSFGKTNFVFALFYGSYYKSVAKTYNLPEKHIQKLEEEFWSRYAHVQRWQEHLFKIYQRHGYTESPLGFRRHGPLKKLEIINTPVQGTSFLLLLLGIRDADAELVERGMKSCFVLQIHDEALFDTNGSEIEDGLEIANRNLTSKKYDWQGKIPMLVDWSFGKNFGELNKI
jgi:DNA polymerase-1